MRRAADGAFAVASVLVLLAGLSLVAWSAELPTLNLAALAALSAQGLVLGFLRVVGARGRMASGLLLFVAVYALNEAREGRAEASEALLGIVVVLTLATAVRLVRRIYAGGDDPGARRLAWGSAFLVPLLVLLASYSGASGGAGGMSPWFAWLPEAIAWPAVVGVRKAIHMTFYPLLSLSALAGLTRVRPDLRANGPWAFGFAAIFAVFDETRQSRIPGRSGSAWDVLLDLAATATVLALVARRAAATDASSKGGDAPQ